jgi:hypothetical protein
MKDRDANKRVLLWFLLGSVILLAVGVILVWPVLVAVVRVLVLVVCPVLSVLIPLDACLSILGAP